MNTNNTSLNIAVTEINQMLNDLRNASTFEEFSMIDNFLRGFAFGQFKQGILTKEEYEQVCSMADTKVVKNSSATFAVNRTATTTYTNPSFTQSGWNISVPCNTKLNTAIHYKC